MNRRWLPNTKLLLPFVAFAMLGRGQSFAENPPLIPVPLDGMNTLLFNQEYPHRSLNMYSIVYGNPLDCFPFGGHSRQQNPGCFDTGLSGECSKDSAFRLDLRAEAGAETGDPMLNVFEGTAKENRDHYTTMTAGCTIPKIPARLFFGYRYVDHYSDRFDQKWNEYEQATGHAMQSHEEGLAYEKAGGFTMQGPLVSAGFKALSYMHWGATPFYFSPMFSSGRSLSPALSFNFPKSAVFADGNVDYHKDYFNHLESTDFTDTRWNVSWQRSLTQGVLAQVSHHHDSRMRPASYTAAAVYDTVENLFSLAVTGTCFGNFRPGGSFDFTYIRIPNVTFAANGSWNYTPKIRDYTFYEMKRRVEYHYLEYESANLHSALTYSDTIAPQKPAGPRIPLSASVWIDYCNNPLWEIVDHRDDTLTVIRQAAVRQAACLTTGGRGACKAALPGRLFLTLWGNASFFPNHGDVRFSLPLNAGADIEYGGRDNDSLFMAIRFEYRGRASLKYRLENTGGIIDTISPANTGISLEATIPFYPPVFRNHITTSIWIEAGPVRLSKEQRVAMHPLGNAMGPRISAGLLGVLR